MDTFVVWVEGVDFDETIFDSEKLSVIRGASRAYEAMPAAVEREVRALDKNAVRIAGGGSQAGYIVKAEESAVKTWLTEFRDRLRRQGSNPRFVEPVTKNDGLDLLDYAPFAHLRFHGVYEKIADGAEAPAIERARAAVRVAQLSEPGVRLAPEPESKLQVRGDAKPCDFDRVRAAEMLVDGPARAGDTGSSQYAMSRATAARWHYGRSLRQRIYDEVRKAAPHRRLLFVDDFQEMIAEPPRLPGKKGERDLPVALTGKIAVLSADGDHFSKLRTRLTGALGAAAGLACLSTALETRMRELLHRLVGELDDMRFSSDGNKERAAALCLDDDKLLRKYFSPGREKGDRLIRFETLVYAGEDILFVVPAWLGWWLALRFRAITRDWKITREDAEKACAQTGVTPDWTKFEEQRLQFSAGLLFASAKTPIRAQKKLVTDLLYSAKDAFRDKGGGIDIEILESIEPPNGGISGHRKRLLGSDEAPLAVSWDTLDERCAQLRELWVDEALPTSQAHRALLEAREKGEIVSHEAAKAAMEYLKKYVERAGKGSEAALTDAGLLKEADPQTALHLYWLLQQRDYVIAAEPWIQP